MVTPNPITDIRYTYKLECNKGVGWTCYYMTRSPLTHLLQIQWAIDRVFADDTALISTAEYSATATNAVRNTVIGSIIDLKKKNQVNQRSQSDSTIFAEGNKVLQINAVIKPSSLSLD